MPTTSAPSSEHQHIGNCYTWIKADTTFAGLLQARRAPDERIYLGDEPPKLAIVEPTPRNSSAASGFTESPALN